MAMKDNSLRILAYLKENNGQKLTTDDVADALGLGKRTIVGSFNSFVKKGLGIRIEEEVELDNGKHETVKYLALTPAGLAFDPDAEDAE